ncbi:hypothetical protein [Paenibacillus silviterrae]|uniref:hypothetical protein n=1 Tax=Paenibacillus silviterrae TaxID=3242194 RepID=UPI002543D867|nr:hypothetical protein [Paenibacillus chinjuensis]
MDYTRNANKQAKYSPTQGKSVIQQSKAISPNANSIMQMQKEYGNRVTQQLISQFQSKYSSNEKPIQRTLYHKTGKKRLNEYGYYKTLYQRHSDAIDKLENQTDDIYVSSQQELKDLIWKIESNKMVDEPMYTTRALSEIEEEKQTNDPNVVFEYYAEDYLTPEDYNDPDIISSLKKVQEALSKSNRYLTDDEFNNEDRAIEIIFTIYRSIANPSDTDITLKVLRYALTGETFTRGHAIGGLGSLGLTQDNELTGRPDFDFRTQDEFKNRAVTHHIRHITAWHNIRTFLNMVRGAFKDSNFIKEINNLLNTVNANEKIQTLNNKGIGDRFNHHYENKKGVIADDTPEKVLMKTAFFMNSAIKNLWAGGGKENVSRNTFGGFLNEKIDNLDMFNVKGTIDAIGNYRASLASLKKIRDDLHDDLEVIYQNNSLNVAAIKARIEQAYRTIEIDYDQTSNAKNGVVHQKIMEIVRGDVKKLTVEEVYEIIKNFVK